MVKLISSASRERERRSRFGFLWKVHPNELVRQDNPAGCDLFLGADLAVVRAARRLNPQGGRRQAGGAQARRSQASDGGNRGQPADLGAANAGQLADTA